ncbi:uncharacterized protein [Coffea arabica]|uniref:SWIM-type domain-containing protein n=1 Tax=Coffea arabica TaxID=13443 RepID=A0A6P6VJ09_COFAR
MERIRSNTRMPTREIRQTVHEEYQTQISKWVVSNARKLALKQIQGSAEAQYKKLWEYCAEIKKTHEGSTMEIMFTPFRGSGGNPIFMRLYCCLDPLKKGFKNGCRPIIGLDGCHLKGVYRGQLLIAIAADPNNGWWPIAWAVVEREATEQWTWFLKYLSDDLEIENQCHYTFISDQQKGLDRALGEVLPGCEHRYCVQHMYHNFKKKHPGLALKDRIWNIASCTIVEMYDKAMEELQTFDKDAYEWVKKAPHPRHWCKAYFPTHVKSDMIVNNLCESFNAHIKDARDQPIITMLEIIREYLMERIQRRRAAMEKCKGSTGPLINEIVQTRVKHSSQWMPIWNALHGYQVKGPRGAQFAVDMQKKYCTCRLWEVSGIPCCHAIAAIFMREEDPYSYLDRSYSRGLFFQIYENVLQPISGDDHWPSSTMPVLNPPIPVTQPGRPKKARRRDVTEGRDHGRRLRRRVVIHCRKCGEIGHNAATCKKPSNEEAQQGSNQSSEAQPSNQQRQQSVEKERTASACNCY